MTLTILLYGDCTSQDARIRENVRLWRCLSTEVSMYVVVFVIVIFHSIE